MAVPALVPEWPVRQVHPDARSKPWLDVLEFQRGNESASPQDHDRFRRVEGASRDRWRCVKGCGGRAAKYFGDRLLSSKTLLVQLQQRLVRFPHEGWRQALPADVRFDSFGRPKPRGSRDECRHCSVASKSRSPSVHGLTQRSISSKRLAVCLAGEAPNATSGIAHRLPNSPLVEVMRRTC